MILSGEGAAHAFGILIPKDLPYYADAKPVFFSEVKSQSILIRFSGRVYKST